MRRWLAIIGLVLTLLIAGVYVGSAWRCVVWRGNIGPDGYDLWCGNGGLGAMQSAGRTFDPNEYARGFHIHPCEIGVRWTFGAASTPWTAGVTAQKRVFAPLWPVLLLAAFWTYTLSPRRFRRGHCSACGYDLKGAPSSTCPECGAESRRGG